MAEIWFTSDTHFDHLNSRGTGIIDYSGRPYDNIDDMNSDLIERWNSAIADEDTVFFLGDFFFRRKDGINPFELFSMLAGCKILIKGNHDYKTTLNMRWREMYDIREIKAGGKKIVMCHYPMETWNQSSHGSVHVHGHSHGKARVSHNRYDVGVDVWDYAPVHIDTVLATTQEEYADRIQETQERVTKWDHG